MISLSWVNALHQDLMDEAYNLWQSNPDWNSQDFINNLKSKIHKDAVVLGNLNYQVENGGFDQWWFNEYGPRDYRYLMNEILHSVNIQSFQIVLNIVRKAVPKLEELSRIQNNWGEDDEDDEAFILEKELDDLNSEYYEVNDQFMEDVEKYLQNPSVFKKQSNQEWFTGDSQTTEFEDRNYVNPLDDNEMRRSNPPNYNKRRDWYDYVDDKGEDSEVSLRDNQTSLTSGASVKLGWQERLRDQLQQNKKTRTKFPEARQRAKDIVKLLQDNHLCSEYPYIDSMTGSYRIKLFRFSSRDFAWKKAKQTNINFDNLQNSEKWNLIDKYEKDEKTIKEYNYQLRKKVNEIENLLDANKFEDCLVRIGGGSGDWILVNVPYTSQKESSWRITLSDLNPAPGFIPTNKGMQTEEDIFDSLDYGSYEANRNYDKTIEPYSDEPNPDYDPEESKLRWRRFWMKHGWSEEKLNRFERRYIIEGN